MAYVKLDTRILGSTLWFDRDVRDVFVTALLMAEPREIREPAPQIEVRTLEKTGFEVPPGWYGFVPTAGIGIVTMAQVEREDGLNALESLGSPDKESRTGAFDGRRMVRVDGGFVILNYMLYRDRDHTGAERSRRYRELKKRQNVTASQRDTVNVTRDDTGNTVTSPRDITQNREQITEDQEQKTCAISDEAEIARPVDKSDEQPAKPKKRKSGTDACFAAFWDAYPVKKGKKTAREVWKRLGLDERIDDIVSHVTRRARIDDQWKRGFIPHPSTFLRQERWDDEIEASKKPPVKAVTPSAPKPDEPKRSAFTPEQMAANQQRIAQLIESTLAGKRPTP